jgi:pSer/pThr/pTyr-binding forkhead associated (FHA) protein
LFRITAYDREGRQVALVDAPSGEISIGREPDRRLCLPSPSVSRRHARIVLDGPQPFIADEGSANGVLVNGVRIGGPTALVPGVRVDIAEYWLDFAILGAPMAVAHQMAAPPQMAPMASMSPMSGAAPLRLRAQGGPFAGRVFDIPGGRVTLGRAIDNDLVFDDPSLSRKHAAVHASAADRIEVQDLGSSNGTWVNGRKVDAGFATIGDAVRFGDLMFVLEGDALPEQAWAGSGAYAAPPRRTNWALLGVIGAIVLVGGVAAAALMMRPHGKSGGSAGGATSAANVAQQVEDHLKAGRDKLADKQFDAALAEFDRTLELDPTNGEARRLKLQAANEPANDKQARQIVAKASLGGRSDLEAAVRMTQQLPSESVFRDPTANKVATKLVVFGDAQCKAKKYADCAWAICKAIDVAPPTARASIVVPAAENEMHDAEKKLARDKGFTPCKKK